MKCNVLYVYCVRHIIYCNNVIGYALGHAAMSGDVSRLLGTPHTRKGLLKYYMSTRITQNIKVRMVGHQKGGGLSLPSSTRAFP